MKRTPLKRKTRLSPVSKRHKEEMKEYSRLSKEFLGAHPVCYVWYCEQGNKAFPYDEICDLVQSGDAVNPCPATDVHHVKKRGKHYLDVSSWMAVSRSAHQRIHDNPRWARENEYLA